ncbi:MAG: MoaD/ThiS family protein [Candidatus Bathyarchaeota archaeon]|nr:MAG: MoaD/ThiS family protein [Candidatus Bathyarchaeota archaeon]
MSIQVKVLLHANLREIVGKREIIEEVHSPAILKHLLDKLAQMYGKDFKQIVDQREGKTSLEFLVSINGQVTRDVYTKLNNNDVVMLSIPVGGG